jgi:hypothetical protein
MKNRHIERLILSAKLKHRHDKGFHVSAEGIRARHVYDDSAGLTWWDDVQFVLNDYRVSVDFTHPRYEYENQVKALASEAVRHLEPGTEPIRTDGTPIYPEHAPTRRLAKKVKHYRLPPLSQEWRDYFVAEQAKCDEWLPTSEVTITPVWTAGWSAWCRYVEITVPLEVRQEGDLLPLVQLVRRLLRGETTLSAEFPGYRYGREQWLLENPDAKRGGQLHVHTVIGRHFR